MLILLTINISRLSLVNLHKRMIDLIEIVKGRNKRLEACKARHIDYSHVSCNMRNTWRRGYEGGPMKWAIFQLRTPMANDHPA